MHASLALKDFLKQLSSPSPTPGGGGSSAVAAAMGMALAQMVAHITLKRLDSKQKKKLKTHLATLKRLSYYAERTIDLDAKVYQAVMNAYQKAKKMRDKRKAKARIEASLKASYQVQANLALDIVKAKQTLTPIGRFAKGSIGNDLIVAKGMLDGAFVGAVATANINVVYMAKGASKLKCQKALLQIAKQYKKITFK